MARIEANGQVAKSRGDLTKGNSAWYDGGNQTAILPRNPSFEFELDE